MRKLFKYLPLRKKFFEDPLIRLTPSDGFNDPFDSKASRKSLLRLVACANDSDGEGFVRESDLENSANLSDIERLKGDFGQYGVLSLSESQDNLLMWSHYANEHKGVVVGYDCSAGWLGINKQYLLTNNPSTEVPLPVTYHKRRLDNLIDDELVYSYGEGKFLRAIFLSKSDEWIYEKEHRVILPLADAHASIVMPHDEGERTRIIGVLDRMGIRYSSLEKGVLKIEGPWSNSEKASSMNFLRPKRGAMLSLTFGCRVSEQERSDMLDIYKSSEYFDPEVRIYQAYASENRFELEIKEISNA